MNLFLDTNHLNLLAFSRENLRFIVKKPKRSIDLIIPPLNLNLGVEFIGLFRVAQLDS